MQQNSRTYKFSPQPALLLILTSPVLDGGILEIISLCKYFFPLHMYFEEIGVAEQTIYIISIDRNKITVI